jgi:hypothetical protein
LNGWFARFARDGILLAAAAAAAAWQAGESGWDLYERKYPWEICALLSKRKENIFVHHYFACI